MASGADAQRPRVGYLGPAGTFTEEALCNSARADSVEPVALASIYETVLAVRRGEVRWAVVPIENSLDGSVTVTLDLLAETGIRAEGACLPASAEEQGDLEIVGEVLLAVRHSLIAAEPVALREIDTVISHPQVPGQCTRLLRGELAHARVLPASSTAEAVRLVVDERRRGSAALGTRLAAEIYGGTVVREGVQDRDDNLTRFVWLARREPGAEGSSEHSPPPLRTRADAGDENRPSPLTQWKTSVVFWGSGADSPGWLVRCLDVFAQRAINLTKIESRPQRARLGHYMFFVDLQGGAREPTVAEALAGLRAVCEQVRVLGSYPAGADPSES
ncbi:MAG TPA: prephenate dehydratase [Solirubrobacteraceae bacterium]|jgi:prephenate dehydratase|nr:prephenate dehydratase [Solirubrobacteraceae bacterium]